MTSTTTKQNKMTNFDKIRDANFRVAAQAGVLP